MSRRKTKPNQTSGITGFPEGVTLTQLNLLNKQQLSRLPCPTFYLQGQALHSRALPPLLRDGSRDLWDEHFFHQNQPEAPLLFC